MLGFGVETINWLARNQLSIDANFFVTDAGLSAGDVETMMKYALWIFTGWKYTRLLMEE